MKILVAHPAQQHSYRLAAALKKVGMLDKYATTVYYKTFSLTSFFSVFLRGKYRIKAKSRKCLDLSNKDVLQFCEWEGLLKLLALNTRFLKKEYRKIKYYTADAFAAKTARYVFRKRADAVITYDDTSPLLFEKLAVKSPDTLRILDMSAASILYMRHIYEKDFEKMPDFSERLKRERAICWDSAIIDRAKREIIASQYFIVPSEFAAYSLMFSGIKKEKIFYCPYGVNIDEFQQKEYEDDLQSESRVIEFIYVGGVKELKGIAYLFEAFSKISTTIARLTVVGNYSLSDPDTLPYAKKVNFTGSVLHSEIPRLLRKSDVFIMPSLGDSFCLAALEAAACGLPIIVTENTGVRDLITDGENGFIVPIQSVDALTDKINYFIENPDQIQIMGMNARRTAEQYTWDRYSENVVKVIENIIQTEGNRRKNEESE